VDYLTFYTTTAHMSQIIMFGWKYPVLLWIHSFAHFLFNTHCYIKKFHKLRDTFLKWHSTYKPSIHYHDVKIRVCLEHCPLPEMGIVSIFWKLALSLPLEKKNDGKNIYLVRPIKVSPYLFSLYNTKYIISTEKEISYFSSFIWENSINILFMLQS
jgi:hypothetical protein